MPIKTPEQFYNDLADQYDSMTRFDQRLENVGKELAVLRSKFHFKTALDIGCGTGLHVCALEQQGVRTIGLDISENMLAKARQHAAQLGLAPQFIKASMLELPGTLSEPVDAIFCLGNSIPHITNPKDIYFAFAKFTTRLRKKGILVLQLLNYKSILASRERIINISKSDSTHVIRFYDFVDPLLRFNILSFHWVNNKVSHSIQSTELFPYTQDQLMTPLAEAGFVTISSFGSLTMEPLNENSSRELVIIAEK